MLSFSISSATCDSPAIPRGRDPFGSSKGAFASNEWNWGFRLRSFRVTAEGLVRSVPRQAIQYRRPADSQLPDRSAGNPRLGRRKRPLGQEVYRSPAC
jgi:hypothetical protein